MDQLAAPAALPGSRPQLVTLGETLASLTSRAVGPLRYARSLEVSIGGAESNVAIGAARMGIRAAWLGRVGDDEFGRLVQSRLRGEGIDVTAIVDGTRPTALMVKSRRSSSIAEVAYYRGSSAGSALDPGDLDEAFFAGARVLHLTGITPALSGTARAAVHRAIAIGRSCGALISFDLNYRKALWGIDAAAAEYRSLAEQSDVLLASAHEAEILVGAGRPEELARRLSDLGPSQVVVKLGSQGAIGWYEGALTLAPPTPVVAVDHVGAGDAFAAGYLSALIAGTDFAGCLELGARLGAFAVTVEGDWEGAPTRAELLAHAAAADGVVR